MLAHGGTAFKNAIGELVVSQDVTGKIPFAGAKFDDSEVVEILRPLQKLFGEQFPEDRIQIGRGIKVAVVADAGFGGGVITEVGVIKGHFHEVMKGNGPLVVDALLKVAGQFA